MNAAAADEDRARAEVTAAIAKIGETIAPLADPTRGPGLALVALARAEIVASRGGLVVWTPGDPLPDPRVIIARSWEVWTRYYCLRGFFWLVRLAGGGVRS